MSFNLANFLTILRVVLSMGFFALYALGNADSFLHVLSLFLLLGMLEATDALDGYVARKLGQVTDLGKILDPMADGVARTTVLLAFTLPPVSLPCWLVLPFLYRDALTATLRIVCAWRGIVLAARASGKIKAVVQALTAFFVLSLIALSALGVLDPLLLSKISATAVAISAAYAVGSAAEYFIALRTHIRTMAKSQNS